MTVIGLFRLFRAHLADIADSKQRRAGIFDRSKELNCFRADFSVSLFFAAMIHRSQIRQFAGHPGVNTCSVT